jgi:hypothetical protein
MKPFYTEKSYVIKFMPTKILNEKCSDSEFYIYS